MILPALGYRHPRETEMQKVLISLIAASLLASTGIVSAQQVNSTTPNTRLSWISPTKPKAPSSLIIKVDSACGGWQAGGCRKCERQTPSGSCYVDRACDPC